MLLCTRDSVYLVLLQVMVQLIQRVHANRFSGFLTQNFSSTLWPVGRLTYCDSVAFPRSLCVSWTFRILPPPWVGLSFPDIAVGWWPSCPPSRPQLFSSSPCIVQFFGLLVHGRETSTARYTLGPKHVIFEKGSWPWLHIHVVVTQSSPCCCGNKCDWSLSPFHDGCLRIDCTPVC